MPDKLQPPFTVHLSADAFWLEDASGVRFCYTYYRDDPVVGTGPGRPTSDVARRFTGLVARLPGGVSMAEDEEAALARFIVEERPGITEQEALRVLAREQLIGMGLLKLGRANRGKVAGRLR